MNDQDVMMAKTADGRVFKRCGCKHPTTHRALGAACPKLKRRNGSWNPKHGSWSLQLELPPTATGDRRYARRSGYTDHDTAQHDLGHIKDLLNLACGDTDTRTRIADLIHDRVKAKQPLPEVDELRKRLRGDADLTREPPTVGVWLEEWLRGKKALADSTARGYSGHIRNYWKPHLGHIRIDRLRVAHINDVFDLIDERNEQILQARASADPAIRASVRGMRTVGPGGKHRIRATLRSALASAAFVSATARRHHPWASQVSPRS